MLELRNIVKCYSAGDNEVKALNGVSMRFRKSEFVSILGKSGCGKTTLLNIIGGLDRYTSGDLIINGRSTKEFKDSDWDVYRNHSIGFVFQSYNLIPHQTVLSNVELALTLSGVSKAERRQRATAALEKVGLGNQLKKKPNQMSGGQMQRVAIARALVNNPDILLADEPTGALDTQTSVQIMDILREVARDKLVIMVTHNPDLAEEYSSRIIKLSDGCVTDDTNPYTDEESERDNTSAKAAAVAEGRKARKEAKKAQKKKSMSFLTALSLSFNNLLTKKTRTILTSFAGSIGIIGIALILSLSNGIQAYIDRVQEDTLSTYPLTIMAETQDYSAMLAAMTEVQEKQEGEIDQNKIYVDDSLGAMMSAMMATKENDLESFKKYLDDNYDKIKDSVSDIQYTYAFDLQVFTADGKVQVSPTEIFDNMGDSFAGISEMMGSMGGLGIMSEMINNQELLDQQYELVGDNSHWPTNANEVVLVVNRNNQISKMTLYMLGILPQEELEDIMTKLMTEGTYDDTHMAEYTLDDFIGMKFYMLNTSDFFEIDESKPKYLSNGEYYSVWKDLREDPGFKEQKQATFVTENGTELVISGIVRPREGVTGASIVGAVGYTKALTEKILDMNLGSEIINQQKKTPETNVLTGLNFERTVYTKENIGDLINKIGSDAMEQFYSYMTTMIRENEDYKDLLNVNAETFVMFATTMADSEQRDLVVEMLEAAKAQPGGELQLGQMLFPLLKTIGQQVGGLSTVDFTVDNLPDLLSLMSPEQLAIMFVGMDATEQMPMAIPGLTDICGESFMAEKYAKMNEKITEWKINEKSFSMLLQAMPDEQFSEMEEALYSFAPNIDATLKSNLKQMGDAEMASPASINFYAKDFESKDTIEAFISEYNDAQTDDKKKIEYTDIVGAMMSSVSIIIDVISYVLIAFVSISLVVSSIMIGIITYISVLERTKEIGVLRSIGASKKDISRVFNAETLIVGLAAGLIGILFTVILCLPINAIIHAVSGIETVNAVLPWVGGVALVIISTVLTMVAGLIPSRIASRKDPVEALRTE